jgi:dephospho-CoA kinase
MRPNKISIAITGGIGSGKSEVCRLLKEMGLPIISADILGHEALRQNNIREKLTTVFGDDILENGNINHDKLRDIVFADKNKTDKLNKLVHPAIINMLHDKLENQENGIAVYEVPLLFEASLEKLFDIIIMVWAPETVRRDRVSQRPGMSTRLISAVMAQQYPQKRAKAAADYVIENSASLIELKDQVSQVLADIKSNMEIEL